MQTEWNTGRHYTAKGQRIAASFVDGIVRFIDVDRGIEGTYKVAFAIKSLSTLQSSVMAHYDHNDYTSPGYSPEEREVMHHLALAADKL